jgi:hypothetical protein
MGARQGLWPGIALLLAGCTVGPDYEAPDYSVPDEWRTAVVEELEDEEAPLQRPDAPAIEGGGGIPEPTS